MTIKFGVEDFQTYMLDALPLWKEHCNEVTLSTLRDKRVLAPDIKKYLHAEETGTLLVFTARIEETNELVGYSIFFIGVQSHYRHVVVAQNDALYMSPKMRGMNSIKFMKWNEEQITLLSKGVVKLVQWRSKSEHDFGKILERMGYAPDDIVYNKWIGE